MFRIIVLNLCFKTWKIKKLLTKNNNYLFEIIGLK